MDITPIVPGDRQLIQGYGDGGFRISGIRYQGSVLVFPTRVVTWPVVTQAEVTPEVLAAVVAENERVQILLLGCGARMMPVKADLRLAMRASGIILEAMDTGAACRTYNVLLAEARPVAAALIAVG